MVYSEKPISQMHYNPTFRMSKSGSTLLLQCVAFVASYVVVSLVNILWKKVQFKQSSNYANRSY